MESRIESLFSVLNRDALQFQTLYYNERKHLEHLDAQRRARLPELMANNQEDPVSA
jgi:DNA primase